MNSPSRNMPPMPEGKSIVLGGAILAAIGLGLASALIYAAFLSPGIAWGAGLVGIPYFLLCIRCGRYWRKLRRDRVRESTCDFARELPARGHDTWVVRAVYEELAKNRGVAIRPLDRLERDLGFLPEDLEDCFTRAAGRAGRSLERCKFNPLYGRVTTVADMVAFLEAQPKSQ